MRMVLLTVALMLAAPAAEAEDWPASVEGLKVVVPEARGPRGAGARRLTRSLRGTLKEALGELVPPEALRKAQRTLGLRGRRRFSDANLVRAGREAGAQWVLDVRITKEKWLYTATARLLNTETGAEQMNFRSGYYKPKKETKDRGFRIARTTIEKLDVLTREGPLPAVAPDPGAARPGSEPTAVAPPPDLTEDDVGAPPPPPPPPVEDPLATRLDDPEPAPAPEPAAEPAPPPAPAAAAVSAPGPRAPDDTEILRFSLGAGAGILRTYDLSSDAVASSRLSHRLDPVTLLRADLEVIVPRVPFTAILSGAFRPFEYGVDLPQERVTPSGTLVDGRLMLGYHFPIHGRGRRAIRLVPLAGARVGVSNVGEGAQGAVLSSTLVAVQGGLLGRIPVNEVLEVNVGAEGGYIVSYSESPATSGRDGAGFTVAGDLGVRIWLSPAVAVAFDSRFTYEQVGFDGAPTRELVDSEQANLQNVTVSTEDLRASVGVAFRL